MQEKREYFLSNQLLRLAPSVGANINEALVGYSAKDFQYKLSIALKESHETEYWLSIMDESKLFSVDFNVYLLDIVEIQKMLTSILKTSKMNNLNAKNQTS